MSNYISNSLINLLELFTSHAHKPSVLKGNVDINQMVEHVVDVVDPRIRVIGRYSPKLTGPLTHTWEYLSELANLIPDGVILNRADYSNDTRMKLIFESQGYIQNLLNSVPPLLQKVTNNTSDRIYMLLCMEKKERSFLGAELAGEIIKRDVLQTKMSFSNRKILSAGFSKEDAKLGFKNCALEGLLQKAHDLVLASRSEHKQLIERKRQLHQQAHTIKDAKYKDHSSLFTRNDHLLGASPELQEIERQLTDIRVKSESPDHHLAQAIEVLSHPEQYIRIKNYSTLLNSSGIVLPANTDQKAIKIEFAELEVDNELKRVTMIISCFVDEVFPARVH